MAREKAPAFQFYPSDWLGDAKVRAMTPEARGAYIDLLCYCWQEQSLPLELPTIARMVSVSASAFKTRLWPQISPCFMQYHGRFRHRRLDQERAKQAAFHAERSEAGRRGAAHRWGMAQPSPVNGSAIKEPMAKNASPSSSSIQIQEPPISPSTRGTPTITKREFQKAAKQRADVFGRCPHDPQCESYRDCVELLAVQAKGAVAQ